MRTLRYSFSGGEVTPEFWGQIADAKFQTGMATCRNFRVLPHGPIENRAGFEFVREVKDSSQAVRLLPFTYSSTQTMVVEIGDTYARYHTEGATILDGLGDPYETTTPYVAADLFGIRYTQSADIVTLTHTGYAPAELQRTAPLGVFTMTYSAINFATTLTAPTAVSAVATPGPSPGTPTTHTYAATSVGADGIDESVVSSSVSCSNNLFDTGAYNTLTFTPPGGITRLNIYKQSNGLWAYLGQSGDGTFVDDNITPDLGKTAPINDNPFTGAGDYPGAVCYFEQRRWFAGSTNKPQTLWATKSGTESNMDYSIPTRDTDALAFRVVAREANRVQHLVPMASLVALTTSAEWRITANNADAITPTSVSVKPQTNIGAADATPAVVNTNVVYAAARGGRVREMAYSWQAGGYMTGDLSLRAPHLFDGLSIVDIAHSKAPYPIVWFVSSNGRLLSLTYVPEQNIGAWSWHDTDGVFESIACVAEGAEDVLYAVVRREIGGATKRYIERLRPRAWSTQADAFHVDSGLTYTGVPTDTISGLNHLEGKTVAILGDGAVQPSKTVVGGSITLDYAASTVHVGLPFTSDMQTLPTALRIDEGFGQGRPKNVSRVWLRVFKSGGIKAGPDFDHLVEAKQRTTESYGTPPGLKTDEIELVLTPSWQQGGQVCVRQSDPLPLTILSMTLEVSTGG